MAGKRTGKPSNLKLVEPHPDPNLNVLLYGPPKTGKTVGAASAPKPLLYLNADRANATRKAHSLYGFDEIRVEGLQSMIEVAEALESSYYASVVVDPLGEVYRLILEGLTGRALHPKIQQYGDTGTHLERFCRMLCEAPVNTVLVAHETSQKDEESGSFERLPYTGTNNPAIGAKVMAMVDVIGYTGVKVEEGQPPEFMATLVNVTGRKGGSRFDSLGSYRTTNLSEWVELARAETAPQQAQKEAAA